eukprot:6057320-Prorocentrum_lima.AAC.1
MLGRSRGASTPTSLRSSLLRGRGGTPAGELTSLDHGKHHQRGRKASDDVNRRQEGTMVRMMSAEEDETCLVYDVAMQRRQQEEHQYQGRGDELGRHQDVLNNPDQKALEHADRHGH